MNSRWRLADTQVMSTAFGCLDGAAAWFSQPMAIDLHGALHVDRLEVVDAVRSRLGDVAAPAGEVQALIESALDELTPASVTTYLPILVERSVRDRLDHR